ncbi:XRE family transcriptional regulator [Marinobacter sp. OP 3.4]|uniref:XRE family transcriptional regulator n=1 Tax=Marinobacter sp. OP 3.4 TaxID=3076501 RepID=UPI002E1A476F
MDMSERITEARESVGLNKSELARRLGVSRASVTAWETGAVNNLKHDHLFELSKITGFSAKWLATGEGEKKRKTASTTVAYLPGLRNSKDAGSSEQKNHELEFLGHMDAWDSDTALGPDEVEVPLFREVEIAAGGGRTEVIENHGAKLRFARSTLARAGVDPANAACATVKGNSMERLIPDGTTVGVDTGDKEIRDGEIYAFDHDGMLRVKYLQRKPGGGLRVISENLSEYPPEDYGPEEVEQDIRMIGRVFWWSVLR